MTDPIPSYAKPLPDAGFPLADIVAAQPLASAIVAFLLLYALLTLFLRLADRIDPPPKRTWTSRRSDPPPPRIWRFRKPA